MIHISQSISEMKSYIPEDVRVFILIDARLKDYYHYFDRYELIPVMATEDNKNFSTIESLVFDLMERGADRNAFILGVGGGITTDMAGFTASIYKRGVRFAFVPTTLLAQVDAAIGGKNGVNVHAYKNMMGVIRQPEWTCIVPEFLKTLHKRELLAGIAEMLKTFIIYDADRYAESVRLFTHPLERLLQEHREELTGLVAACAGYKEAVVRRDEFEKGERRLLNLGHTFAHAIEKYRNAAIMHGEAVAIGMVMAAQVAEEMHLASPGLKNRLETDFRNLGLPVRSDLGKDEFFEAMCKDKKMAGDRVHLILPLEVGKVEDVLLELNELKSMLDVVC